MSDLLLMTIREAFDSELEDLAEAESSTVAEAVRSGEVLLTALARGIKLDRSMLITLNDLIERHIAELTWQTGFDPVPRPPWVEVGPRLRKVRAILEEAIEYLDDDVRYRINEYIRRTQDLKFRIDAEVEIAEKALRRGEMVRLPPLRPVNASLGPTSWSSSQGLMPRKRLFAHLGQDPIVLTLMLRQDRAWPGTRRLELFARTGEHSWIPVDYEIPIADNSGTTAPRPVEGLERIAGDPRLAGWHVAFMAYPALWSVTVKDLNSPLGVYVQVPEHIDRDA